MELHFNNANHSPCGSHPLGGGTSNTASLRWRRPVIRPNHAIEMVDARDGVRFQGDNKNGRARHT